MVINLKYWTITIESRISKYIIDDVFKLLPTTEGFDVEQLLEEILKSRKVFKSRDLGFISGVDLIERSLLSYGLAIKQEGRLILTDTGRLAKELGGFTQYRKYKRLQLTFVRSQNRINIGLLIIASLSLVSPFTTEWSKEKIFNKEFSKQPVHVIIDSIFVNNPRVPGVCKTDTITVNKRNTISRNFK